MNSLSKILICFFLGAQMHADQQQTLTPPIPQKEMANPIKVRYTNYRGETAVRTIIPLKVYFGLTTYHHEEQWLLEVWDCDRNSLRVYALREITQWFL